MFNGKLVEIISGEYYTSRDCSDTITTLLGSCVSVCLYDITRGIGGMNHYMLPYPRYKTRGFGRDPRYGSHAMELLLRDLTQKGAKPDRLQAKLFGGGRMFESRQYNVADENIGFAVDCLASHGIPIVSMDVGGVWGRKIYYQLSDHRVYVRRNAQSTLGNETMGEGWRSDAQGQ